MSSIIPESFLISQKYFSSSKDFKYHLKMFQQKATKTLSQLSLDSKENITSSNFKENQNENMCYGLPYTPLE